jgi:hypothetical protein
MPRSPRPFLVGIVLSLTLLVSACSTGTSQDVGQGPVPDDVVALIDQWKQATDSSIVDLYTDTGYHLYGAEQFAGDDLATHLTSPSALNVGHEELTPLLLLVDEPGRWVLTPRALRTPSAR